MKRHLLLLTLTLVLLTLLPRLGQAQFVVNEVLANEPGSEVGLEWIELHNAADTSVNVLSFYTVQTSSGGSVGLSGSIAARGYIVVCRDTVRFEEHWGDSSGVWGDVTAENYRLIQGTFSLGNSSGTVSLVRLSNTVSTFTWDANTDDGVSWERIRTTEALIARSIDPGGSTPGNVNSRTPLTLDLSVDALYASSDSGQTLISYVVTNRGLTPLSDPVVHLSYFDSMAVDSIGTFIANARPGPIDSQQTAIFPGVYTLPGMYQHVIAWVDDDDRDNNNRFAKNVPGSDYPPIIINEFLADPEGALASEWVEIKNISDEAVDLLGWQLGDSLDLSEITATSSVLEPGAFLVLVQDAFLFSGFYSDFAGTLIEVADWRSLNNSSDVVVLVDNYGLSSDHYHYESVFGGNQTWGRGSTEETRGKWGRSVDVGGTPGEENLIRFSTEGETNLEVIITPQIISPDGDGVDDSTVILITAPEATGYTLQIYDSEGRKIRTLEEDAPDLSPQYVWNGCDGGGRRMPIGIYILFFEADGVQSVKKTIVVAR